MIENAKYIMKVLSEENIESRIAGGAVRDYLFGIEPKDYDLATPAIPEVVKISLRKHGIRTVDTGISHGTISAILDDTPFEITTLRKEQNFDGRRCEVSFGASWFDDASRRDFTINSMFMDLNGKIYDFFGGVKDIKKEKLVFVGAPTERIKEDYLRILRFFRFLSRFKFSTNDIVLEHIQNNVNGLDQISSERILTEVTKISDYDVFDTYEKMNISGTSKQIFGKDLLLSKKISGSDHIINLYRMGIHSDWFQKMKASSFEIQKIKFFETFTFSDNPNYDRYKFGEWVDEFKKINSVDVKYEIPSSKFPVNGNDLSPYFVGKEIGLNITYLQKLWAKSGFTLEKDELLKYTNITSMEN